MSQDFIAQRTKILSALKKGPRTNVELSRIALRFSGRIFELRKRFRYKITVERLQDGLYLYTLEK